MQHYPADPEFPDARLTQEITLYHAQRDELSEMMRAFEKAREHQWTDWVDRCTPFGDEAWMIHNWFYSRSSDPFSTTDPETIQKQTDLRTLLLKIEDHCFPQETNSSLPSKIKSLSSALFNNVSIRIIVSIFVLILLIQYNPNSWKPLWVQIALSLLTSGSIYLISASLFGAPRDEEWIPGRGFLRSNNIDLGDRKLFEVLDPICLSESDYVYALFGEWRYLSPEIRGLRLVSLRPIRTKVRIHNLIKFRALNTDVDVPTNEPVFPFGTQMKAEVWNTRESAVQELTEGASILFVYCTRVRTELDPSGVSVKSDPIALFDIKTEKLRFFETSQAPVWRCAALTGLAISITDWISRSTDLDSHIFYAMVSFIFGYALGIFAAKALLRSRYRNAIADLFNRVEYRTSLVGAYMRLQTPDVGIGSGKM